MVDQEKGGAIFTASVSGTPKFIINNSGNVGIGTTAPNNKLSIVGVATTGDDALPALGANGGKFAVLNGGGSGAYGLLGGVLSTGNAFLQVQRVDTTATAYNMLLQPNGGNVGIGTTNPIGKLDISTSGTISPGGTWGNNILRIGKAGLSSGVGSDALGLGYDTTNEIGEIEAVSPGNSWRPIRMDASNFQLMGNVGIGRTPTANALEVNGTASKTASGSWLANSDRRIKTDIQDIPDALSTLESLRPVSFKYTDAYQKAENGVGDYTYYNFIAQEFQQVFPNNVQDSGETIDGNSHILQIDTYPVIPYLVKGIQEQQTEIATNSAQLANLSLDSDGNLNISQDNSGNYQLTNTSNGSVINQIAALGELVAGNIKAGLIQTTDFIAQNITAGAVTASTVVADNLTATSSTVQELAANSFTAFQGTIDHMLITSGLVAGNIQTKLISPLADETNVTVQVGSEATPSGQFVIQNASGSAVATIDNTGNATFSGTVSSNQLSVESNASISGTLYADNIKSRSLDDIQALLTQVQADQSLLSQASSWNIDTATNSANLSQLAVSDLYITNQAAIDSLSVTKTVTVGTDLVFSSTTDSQQSIVNSIDTLSAPLRIQSLAMAPVEIMNGLVTIDTKGNVQIAGDLYVAGRIHSSGLTLEPEPTGTDLVNGEATESAQLLTLQNNQGSIVASIDASGSAVFTNIQTQKITGSDEDRGSVEILPAEDSKIIQREWTSTPSAVLVSTSYKTQAWVTDTGENGFTVHVSDSPLDAPGKIYWWALW
jgi:cytoskeletal protein CcmA (bactofilin family)